MKKLLQKIHTKISETIFNRILIKLNIITGKLNSVPAVDKGTQLLLKFKFREMLEKKNPLPDFKEIEFKVFSQNGEDGILWFIFSLIGTTDKRCVEICAGDGVKCNTSNLIINHGWIGLLFDGDKENISKGQKFYKKNPSTINYPPRFVHAWITRENINQLIADNGFTGEIDLLSLDIDGMDYWILEAITTVSPRVIVLEYNNLWGPDKSVSVPYKADFRAGFEGIFGVYCGASLLAFTRLLKRKGYRLVGCQEYGYNAFFIKNGIREDILPEVKPESCFKHPFTKFAHDELLPKVKDKEWVEIN